MTLKIPPRLRPYLKALLKRGLHGSSEDQVAIRLIEEALRRIVVDEYLQKADAARRHLE